MMKGDVVCYKAAFLRSVGWLTNVPTNGVVVDDTDPTYPRVQWCDDDRDSLGVRVHAGNLLLYADRHKEPA